MPEFQTCQQTTQNTCPGTEGGGAECGTSVCVWGLCASGGMCVRVGCVCIAECGMNEYMCACGVCVRVHTCCWGGGVLGSEIPADCSCGLYADCAGSVALGFPLPGGNGNSTRRGWGSAGRSGVPRAKGGHGLRGTQDLPLHVAGFCLPPAYLSLISMPLEGGC